MKQKITERITIDIKLQQKLKSEAGLLGISLKKYAEDRLQRETIHDILIRNFEGINEFNVSELVNVIIESNEFCEIVRQKLEVINKK